MSEKIWFTSDNHFYHKSILKFAADTRKHHNVDADEEIESMIRREYNFYIKGGVKE